MKKCIVSFLAVTAIFLLACNASNTSNKYNDHQKTGMDKHLEPSSTGEGIKEVVVTYTHVDPSAAIVIKEAVSHYLQIQHSLAGDNPAEAAGNAKALLAALTKLDKSFLTASQKMEYDQLEIHLEAHAKQIEKSGSDISAQRTQFTVLSEKVYEMAKTFGAGKPVYHIHCAMARNNEGAMWLGDSREISNPYFGKDMLNCGSIKETIQ